jgi:hypothetical protein
LGLQHNWETIHIPALPSLLSPKDN